MISPATTTTGMTTAIAIFAPVVSPPLPPEPEPDALSAEGDDDVVVDVCDEEVAVVGGGAEVGAGRVEVTITTEGAWVGLVAGGV